MTRNSAEALRQWARDASPGASYVYFVGDLNAARQGLKWGLRKGEKVTDRTKRESDALGFAAEQLAADGVISPVQKRLSDHEYQYIAQRTKNPFISRPYDVSSRAVFDRVVRSSFNRKMAA